jgi:hypothetical protein
MKMVIEGKKFYEPDVTSTMECFARFPAFQLR